MFDCNWRTNFAHISLLFLCQVRNEPCNVSVACEHVAKTKNLDVATVAQVTSENAVSYTHLTLPTIYSV